MKPNLVYSDKQTALQSISPSAGPPVRTKKKMNKRFPSSSRVNNDYFVVSSGAGAKFQQPSGGGADSGEGLPQIVSPSAGGANNSNSFTATQQQQQEVGGLFGPERKSCSNQTSQYNENNAAGVSNSFKLPASGSIATNSNNN